MHVVPHKAITSFGHVQFDDHASTAHLQDGHELSDDKRHRHKERRKGHAWKGKHDLQSKRLQVGSKDARSPIQEHEHEAGDHWGDGKGQVEEGEDKRLARKVVARELQRGNHPKDGVYGDGNGCQGNRELDLQCVRVKDSSVHIDIRTA